MRKLQLKGLTYEQIQGQAKVFLSPEIDHASLVLVRESLFKILMGFFPRVQTAPVGENIVTLNQGFVDVYEALAVRLLEHWKHDVEAIFGDEGWLILKAPLEQLCEFLREGQPVTGDANTLLFSFQKAERALVDLRDTHLVIDHAVKRRDPADRSFSLQREIQLLNRVNRGRTHE